MLFRTLRAGALASLFLLYGCAGKADPSAVVCQAVSYLSQANVENYLGCYHMSNESREYICSVYNDYLSAELDARGGVDSCTILSQSLSSDAQSATVMAELHYGDGTSAEFRFSLRLVGSRWKIVLNK